MTDTDFCIKVINTIEKLFNETETDTQKEMLCVFNYIISRYLDMCIEMDGIEHIENVIISMAIPIIKKRRREKDK